MVFPPPINKKWRVNFTESMLCGYMGYIYLTKKGSHKMEDARGSKTPSINVLSNSF
jgi:hypothetical protein